MKTVKRTIGDLGVIFDGPHATPRRLGSGDRRFLNISSLDNGRLDLKKSDFIGESDFVKWTRRVKPVKGDLLFSYETRLGDAALMIDGVEACLGRRMALIRPKPEIVEPRFLLYKWLSPYFRREINRRAVRGATVDRIPLNNLAEWPVDLPSLEAQVAIGEVLGSLDDKIAANKRVVDSGDRLLHAWWGGKTSNRGKPVPLSSLAKFVNGKAFTKGASSKGRVVVRIAELNSGITGSTVRNELVVDPDHEVDRGDFLMAWSGSLTTARWFRDQAIVNQHIFKVIPKGENPLWAVACAVDQQMEYFKRIAADKATTMGHIQRRHLDEQTLWVDDLTLEEERYGQSLWERALAAEVESERLARTRDELLPLLMDGRITVKDAERVVEEA